MSLRRVEVRVATSDGLEQTVVLGRGAVRVSSRELLLEMDMAREARSGRVSSSGARRSTVADRLPQDVLAKLERMRREQ